MRSSVFVVSLLRRFWREYRVAALPRLKLLRSLMKRPLFASAALVWFVAPLWSQFSIAGPDTGKAGQTLAYALENSGQPVAADAWSQGFNPDRYAGYDYATSFLLTLKPQPDGTVQFTAPAPGRYRLIAFKNDVTVRKIVMISPVVISPAIRGLVLFLSANGNSSDAIRQAASDSLANARLAGATWIAITNYTCMQADAPGFPFSADPANCYSVQTTDLEWILDEAHRQGLKVALEPGAKGRLGTGVLTDLQFYLQGLSDANILQIQQSYGAFILSMATVAQKHGVEALFVGDNWQMLSPWSQSLLTSMNLQWDALVGQIRSAFAGKIWMGWVFSCLGQWPGFADWSRVDAIHHLDRLTPSGTACQNPVVPGIFNLSAEEMAVRLQKQFELPVFQLQARTHLPLIWGDFYPVAYDGTGFFMEDNTPWNGVPVIDRQEMIDGFEARMRAITFSGGDGFFVWGTPDAAFMSAASNWWGGNPKLFEPCLQPMVDGVLFQRSSTCPLPSATGVSDSWDDFTMVEDVQFNGGGGIAQVAFRIPISGPYAAYNVQLGATSLSLTKFVNGASLKLGGYNIPGGSLGKLLRITVTAVGPSLSVAVNGIVVIRAVDNNAPLLSGTTQWGICCGSASVQYGDVVVSTLANASSTAPQVKAVTNAASFLTGTISPGELLLSSAPTWDHRWELALR